MANFAYTPFKANLGTGSFDWTTGTWTVMLVMTNTTADTEEDSEFITDITTLDEMDGSGYSRQDLTNSYSTDTSNDRGEFDATDVTFSSIGAGTRDIAAAVYFKKGAADSSSSVALYVDTGGFPIGANGGDIIIQHNAQGVWQIT